MDTKNDNVESGATDAVASAVVPGASSAGRTELPSAAGVPRSGMLAGLVGGLLSAAAALSLGWYIVIKPMQQRMQQTPPVVVVDFVQLAKQYPEGASAEEVDQLMLKTNRALLKLRDAGYVVLDAQAVLAAPDELLVTTELLQ